MRVGTRNPKVLKWVLMAPEVSRSHQGVSAHVVGGLVSFRVGKSKREDHCDFPDLLLRSTSNHQVTKGFMKLAKGTNSEPKTTSSPR